MKLNRRELVAGLAAAALRGQAPPSAPAPRARPTICLHSQVLIKLHYSELGGIVQQLGFEGCDLTMRKGGHVAPELAAVDVVRSIESLRGEGVEVPMITTDFLSAADPWVHHVLGLAGSLMQVPYFVPGLYSYPAGSSIESRLSEVRRDLAGLVAIGGSCGMTAGVLNVNGYVGGAVWDIREIVAPLDPRWVGYCFDPCHATAAGGVEQAHIALRLALPRLKMMAVRDFYWEKTGGRWAMRACPLGEGMVDWPGVLRTLAAARFTGPLSLHMDYQPPGEAAAIARDLAYLTAQVEAAWQAPAPAPQRS
jgi:sugar phosphate isomerase/epimerase